MAAGIYDIIIEQGADWRLVMTWKSPTGEPMNLNGYGARMQVRESWNSKAVIFDLTTDNGRITMDHTNGVISLNLPASATAQVPINPAKTAWVDGKQGQQLVFDLEVIDQVGTVTRLIQGAVLFIPEVTR